eukprot:SAG31_NODE_27321_length_428_cov_0.498480_1_plen_52_part_10
MRADAERRQTKIAMEHQREDFKERCTESVVLRNVQSRLAISSHDRVRWTQIS